MIELFLDISPIAQGRPRFGQGFTYTPAKSRVYKTQLEILLRQAYRGSPLEGPLTVWAQFFLEKPPSVKREFPCVKPDIDNYAKALFDACNLIVWLDDAQIVDFWGIKRYGKPGILLKIEPL